MKCVQDLVAQVKQVKTQTYVKHQVTLESNVDNEEQAPSVALTCVQQDDPTKEQQGKEKIPHKN